MSEIQPSDMNFPYFRYLLTIALAVAVPSAGVLAQGAPSAGATPGSAGSGAAVPPPPPLPGSTSGPASPARASAPVQTAPVPAVSAGVPSYAKAPAGRLAFQTHASFFSAETNQPFPIDPQVFIRYPDAPAGVGPQRIDHFAGYLPAPLASNSQSVLYNAAGAPLSMTLGFWLAAKGSATFALAPTPGSTRVSCTFSALVPGGRYSLFLNTFSPTGVTFAPLDGTGTKNSFNAEPDGTASISVDTNAPLTHANAVLLVYHSDGKAHGMERGQIGVTAHHQLIARIP